MNQPEKHQLPAYIKRLSHSLSQLIQIKAEPYGITNAQLNVMFCLKDGEAITQKQLLHYLDVKSSTLTVLLEQLERKGLIIRKQHPNDLRAKILLLSEKGKKFIDQTVEPMAEELENHLLKGFEQSEKTQLFNLLDQLLLNMEQTKKKLRE
ncbi:MarR family winged helix-turn-helix transcriptional regulator [Lederbergia galactosidilytica]|uniref:MarR family winged helix-turn-helix transcriptional regulator n=1 Tax=Lederbergia galactosidilytica TaxID=217031 RepID=UPI000716EEAD|nr:MarR family transcriptional regulator [Lederbergia galactosidilytica]MBP1916306.1 DNA-binding MarR family transcriptional regulator [Lederbergia galactosidilytica]